MLKAESEGITPQALVARYASERPQYLNGFHIKFDHWHSTDTPENVALSQDIYRSLKAAGFIDTRTIEQFYDPVRGLFMPDRRSEERREGKECVRTCDSRWAPNN